MSNKIRDLREKFFQIDDEYLNGYAKLCGINATGVYLSMCRHANKQQTCFPSKKLIAEELAISERSVYRALKKLEKWNIIIHTSQGRKSDGSFRNTLYTLLDKKVWKIKPSAIKTDRNRLPHSQQPSATQSVHRLPQVPNKDTHIKDTHKKETHIASKLAKSEISNLLEDKQKHIQIIGLYGKAKQVIWDNKKQQQSFIKRNLRSARDLVGYDFNKIVNTMKYLIDNADFKWTLETVGKFIDEDLDKLKKLTKSEDDIIKDILNK